MIHKVGTLFTTPRLPVEVKGDWLRRPLQGKALTGSQTSGPFHRKHLVERPRIKSEFLLKVMVMLYTAIRISC